MHPRWAAQHAATGEFAGSGQICVAVERIDVHEAIAARFLDALVELAENTRPAPLVDRRHREHVHSHIAEAAAKGATVHTGGHVPDGPGAHYPATVLSACTPSMRVMSDQTFGPVAPVRAVRTFDQGLLEAAGSEYGLAATGSMGHAQRAWRELPVGTVRINSVFGGGPGGAAHPRRRGGQEFGFGPELLDEMTTTKVVHSEPPTV